MWWNMDPLDNNGEMSTFTEPRHGFPLTAGGITKSISSLAYIDDANRYIAIPKKDIEVTNFFKLVQAYCDLMADLSLAIKMGRKIKKCIIRLYNIPEGVHVPEFTSMAWSYEYDGPTTGILTTVRVQWGNKGHVIKPVLNDKDLKEAEGSYKGHSNAQILRGP